MRLYWARTYNYATRTDDYIELRELAPGRWGVVVNDSEFRMKTSTPADDYWGLVLEAITRYRNR